MFTPAVPDANTIAFATRQAQPSTRSAVTLSTIDRFTVSAVDDEDTPFFNNEEFIFNPTANVFTSVTPHYWPTTGTLSFYAISDPGHRTVDAANVPMYTYENWAAEKDLVAATVKAGEKQIPYPLIFKHLTSQVYVSAEAEDKTEELTYKLVSVRMTAPSYGTYSFADATGGVGTWNIDNSQTSIYSYDDALPMTFRHHGQIELSSCYWNILPVADGQIHFDVEYQVLQNGRIISDFTGANAKECIASSQTLLSGKRYIYNFILTRGSDETITFTLTMSDWENGGSTDLTPKTYVKSFALSQSTVSIGLGDSETLSATDFVPENASHDVVWTSDNEEIASVDPETGVVTGVALGDAVITATATDGSGISQTCNVSVIRLFPEPDGYVDGYAYIDLGLPSGTKWSTKNVGSEKESVRGNFFDWGGTFGYSANSGHLFSNSIYKYSDQGSISSNLSGSNDAATVNMSSNWRMPSKEEMQELIDNTDKVTTVISGSKGMKFISKTDPEKFIFFPASSYKQEGVPGYTGYDYWTSTIGGVWYNNPCAYSLVLYDTGLEVTDRYEFRAYGQQVRGVVK